MNQTSNSTAIMKSSRLSTKISRVVVLLTAVLGGVFLQPNVATAQTTADLAIAAYNTTLDVYTNDYMPYTMFVTNFGPGTVSSVVVTNILPSGFSLVDASPAYTLNGNTITFNLGSLANLAVQKLVVRAKPASAGSYTFSATVSSTSNTDPNTANNSASFGVSVGNYLSGNVGCGATSTQVVDLQDGLKEQWMQITNNGSSSIPSARVIVTGLTTNQLWNAAGTNNGNPFIIYGSTLNPGQNGNLLLQFFPRGSVGSQIPNIQLQAFPTPLASLSPPPNWVAPFTPFSIVRITSTNSIIYGSTLVWYPTSTNIIGKYAVVYSDDAAFSHPLMTFPIGQGGGGNLTEFIDYGPPATISLPTNSAPRYYRIYLIP